MKRQLLAFLCLIIILTTSAHANATTTDTSTNGVWPEGPFVYAESAIVMEASTGLILYEKNINEKHYPASITKIMTALLAIENSSLGDTVTFSTESVYDVDLDSSRIGIDVGEKLTMQQCLYGIMLESANEVSYAIAEHVAGSVEEFAKLMNEKAKSLGCLNTNFTNPHGLPDDSHVTSAYDMALITRAAMANTTFRKITGARTYQIPPTNLQSETRYLRNHHRFILGQDYLYEDCIGGKTGYTSKSLYTLVSVAKRGDLELICVVMKDDSFEHQYTDTQKLFNYGFDNFSIYPINEVENNTVINESPLFTRYNPMLSKSDTPMITDEKGYLVLPNTASFDDAQKEVSFLSDIELKPGDNIVGKLSYTYNDKYVGGANIIYHQEEKTTLNQDNVVPTNLPDKTDNKESSKSDGSLRPLIIGVILGIIALIIGVYYITVERPRIKRRNAYYKKRQNRRRYDDDYLDFK
ncbi:MAG: putative secreted protein [Herbinix sp.]|jgi:D-alanyl-D-alanine carboxypeptidase|nr:putative secreted protein [Herbinix sp.]